MGTDKETEATRQELEDLRQNLCKEFTDRVPSTTDAAMHVLYLDKALQDIKEAYKDRLTWELEDYRQFYEALQQSKVYRTENPQHWWAWSKWFQSQSKAAQVELLKQAGLFALQKGLLVAAIGGAFSVGHWFLGRSERKTQAIYQDWQVINSAQGKPGSGGRVQAIQNLYRQGESLVGLSAPEGAYLAGLNLAVTIDIWHPFSSYHQANLTSANLTSANLTSANLTGANLSYANLTSAKLSHGKLNYAKFTGADLSHTNLTSANLTGANLESADLNYADFRSLDRDDAHCDNLTSPYCANLTSANFTGADLSHANLSGTDLSSANFSYANLTSANLSYADFSHANFSHAILLAIDLRGAKNFDPTQLEEELQPLLCNVFLSEDFKDKDKLKDRDCDRLPQELFALDSQRFRSLKDAKKYVDEARQKRSESNGHD